MKSGPEELLSIAEAQAIVLRYTQPLAEKPHAHPLSPWLLGRMLAEDVPSDLDVPPFDKALMDGYALRSADLNQGPCSLVIVEEITAGKTPQRPVGSGQAARIMTGAPLPPGADAVVQVERTRLLGDSRVQIEDRAVKPDQNVMRQGCEMRRGQVVLRRGCVLRPQELGILATVGRTVVSVQARPRVAILSTGDELVEPNQVPQPGQIRNSNGSMLMALTARAFGFPQYLGIAPDQLEALRESVEGGLAYEVLLLSGGVSAGKLDLVPGVLRDLGVTAHFHKVAMKPGKPIFFGTRGNTLVFGLPGNPVSALVGFELFVRPALRRLRGLTDAGMPIVQAQLTEDFAYRTDRPTYHPAWLESTAAGWSVRPVPWFGSPDLRSVTAANAFLIVSPGDHRFAAGQALAVLCVEQAG